MASFLNKLAGIKDDEDQDSNQLNSESTERDISIDNTKQDLNQPEDAKSDWLDENYEGQLSVDVYGTDDEIVVVSTIAGVKPEDIDIAINNDMLTIRGQRSQETEESADDYYYQECYWGGFSRSIILPVEIEPDEVAASLKNGVLTVRLPRSKSAKNISVKVKDED